MARNVYVVTRLVTGSTSGIPVPNLGVHSAFKRAMAHFDLVKDDRLGHGYTCAWDMKGAAETNKVRRAAYLHHIISPFEVEELRIEEWSI